MDDALLERARACMARALKLDPAQAAAIGPATTAADVPGWTSLAHLGLILELETEFSTRFANSEIAGLGSVAAITAALSNRQ